VKIGKDDPEFCATVCPRMVTEISYTGYQNEVQKCHPPWITDENHLFVRKTVEALCTVGQTPKIKYWRFGTDGSMTAGMLGIPTIGYSGGEECYAHTPQEKISIDKMIKALEGYYSIVAAMLDLKLRRTFT